MESEELNSTQLELLKLDVNHCDFAAYSGKIERDMLHKESGTTCFTKGV